MSILIDFKDANAIHWIVFSTWTILFRMLLYWSRKCWHLKMSKETLCRPQVRFDNLLSYLGNIKVQNIYRYFSPLIYRMKLLTFLRYNQFIHFSSKVNAALNHLLAWKLKELIWVLDHRALTMIIVGRNIAPAECARQGKLMACHAMSVMNASRNFVRMGFVRHNQSRMENNAPVMISAFPSFVSMKDVPH